MIYFTQLIYLQASQEQVFHQFESLAIPIMSQYNGKLLLRVRPTPDNFIDAQLEQPYEIHFGVFASEQDFQAFMKDETRKKFLHLKEQSIRSSVLVKGTKL